MEFVKMHGTGNDFVLVDGRRVVSYDWSALAREVCDRHFGIGADGLILVLPGALAPYRMRIFNPDGSEAEMCGNGIRCFAKYLYDRGLIAGETVAVETGAGVLRLSLQVEDGRCRAVTVNMGRPRLDPAALPAAVEGPGPVVDYPLTVDGQRLALTLVSMGNPHAVAFLDTDLARFPLERIGPLVEHHPLFPRRTNVEIARVVAPGEIQVRVWERGAGLTLACGTGASAVAVAARLKGLTGDHTRIHLPGGTLDLVWDGAGEVWLTGPAEEIFTGVYARR